MSDTQFEEKVNKYFGVCCPQKQQNYQVRFSKILDAYMQCYRDIYQKEVSFLYICRCPHSQTCSQGHYETSYHDQNDIDQDIKLYAERGYHCIFREKADVKDHFNRWKIFGDLKYELKFFGYQLNDLIEKENGELWVNVCHSPIKRSPRQVHKKRKVTSKKQSK